MARGDYYQTGYACERCDSDTLLIEGATNLTGVYEARLCVRCRNEWDRFLRSHDTWLALIAIEAKDAMLPALTCKDGKDRTDELIQVRTQRNAILTEIADVAAQWMKDA